MKLAGQEISNQNQDYLVASPWQKAIEEFIDNKPFETLTTEILLRAAIEKPLDRQTKADQMQVADVLKRLGYDKKRITVNGRRQWEWYKV